MQKNQLMACAIAGFFAVNDLMGEVIEKEISYYCQVSQHCGYQPMGDLSTNCSKEKACKHQFTIINQSEVRWLVSIIEGSASPAHRVFNYEVVSPFSFMEYSWQQSAGTEKYRSEWDPNFRSGEDPLPPDPVDFPIKDLYIIAALTEQALKDALKAFAPSRDAKAVKEAVIVKLVAPNKASNKESAVSTLVFVGAQLNAQSIRFVTGPQAAEIDRRDMSKITKQNREYRP